MLHKGILPTLDINCLLPLQSRRKRCYCIFFVVVSFLESLVLDQSREYSVHLWKLHGSQKENMAH